MSTCEEHACLTLRCSHQKHSQQSSHLKLTHFQFFQMQLNHTTTDKREERLLYFPTQQTSFFRKMLHMMQNEMNNCRDQLQPSSLTNLFWDRSPTKTSNYTWLSGIITTINRNQSRAVTETGLALANTKVRRPKAMSNSPKHQSFNPNRKPPTTGNRKYFRYTDNTCSRPTRQTDNDQNKRQTFSNWILHSTKHS